MLCQNQAFATEKKPDVVSIFLISKKTQVR